MVNNSLVGGKRDFRLLKEVGGVGIVLLRFVFLRESNVPASSKSLKSLYLEM